MLVEFNKRLGATLDPKKSYWDSTWPKKHQIKIQSNVVQLFQNKSFRVLKNYIYRNDQPTQNKLISNIGIYDSYLN